MATYNILLMGASYGSLLASKLLFGGHSIHLVCLPPEADLINAEGFRVRGARPERWVRQTDFSNDEAVGYLGDRLARLGVEEELMAQGAVPGVAVMIGPDENAVVFDWHPSIMANTRSEAPPRGTDVRVDLGLRRSDEDNDGHDD